jgi:hypothetical protein
MPVAKVVALDGRAYANPSDPDPLVIAEIEELLEKARAGEVTGIAWASYCFDGTGNNHFEGLVSRNTVGQLHSVMTRISRRIDEA